jgi:hypothetical protein
LLLLYITSPARRLGPRHRGAADDGKLGELGGHAPLRMLSLVYDSYECNGRVCLLRARPLSIAAQEGELHVGEKARPFFIRRTGVIVVRTREHVRRRFRWRGRLRGGRGRLQHVQVASHPAPDISELHIDPNLVRLSTSS